jgi:FkbM family methyltransferase
MNALLKASIRTTAKAAHLFPFGQSIVSDIEVYFSQVLGIGYVATMKEETRAALQCIHSTAPVVFDVGANKGDWTRDLLKEIPPQAHIYAFDPSSANIEVLRQIGDSRVSVIPLALGKSEGEMSFYSPFPGSGCGSLFNFRPESSHPIEPLAEEKVLVTTLDAFVKQQGIVCIDFMKMDLEGAELSVLEGGMETLKAGIVHAFSFEFGQCNIASKTYLLDFWYFLNGFSYRLYLIGPNGILVPIQDYSPRYEVLRHSNFIALHDPKGVPPTRFHR